MEERINDIEQNELTETEVSMAAAEECFADLFACADDDSCYHHSVDAVRDAMSTPSRIDRPDEVAESILAWSFDLS